MKILRNYILREIVVPFFLSLFVLTCVFLLGYLIQLAHLVINKGVSLLTIGKVFCLYIPVLLGYTIPIACLVGIILGFSRLSTDNEILAIRANGIHLRALLLPLITIGIILSLCCFLLNDRIIPYAYYAQRQMLKSLGTQNPTALLEARVFIHAFEGQIIFIDKIEDNKLYNVAIYQPQPDGKTILASRGEFSAVPGKDQIMMKLIDGTADEPDKDHPQNFYKLNFNTFFMTLDASKNKGAVDKKPKSMSLKELTEEKQRLEKLLVETARIDTEYHRKISWAFSAFIFILLGFPLAVITNKREKAANVVLAMICAAVYYLMTLGCENLGMENVVPAAIIMWVPNIIALLVTSFFNYKLLTS